MRFISHHDNVPTVSYTHLDVYKRQTLESAIPCETQAIKWSVASRERYYNIAAKCDKETMLQREYTPDCMDKRNRYMVDHADYILAVWNGCPSGTGNLSLIHI